MHNSLVAIAIQVLNIWPMKKNTNFTQKLKKEPHKLEAPTDKISWRLINFATEIH